MKELKTIMILIFLIMVSRIGYAQNIIEEILYENEDLFGDVLSRVDIHKVQILYTQIDRDSNNVPSFKTYSLGADPKKYFYPASTVKFPAAVLALEKLNDLDIPGLDKETPLKIDSAFSGQTTAMYDSSSKNYLPSIAHYIKKIFIVSDNDAFNRLYEFLGQEELNLRMHRKGFDDVKLIHRLSVVLTQEENRNTNPFTFYEGDKIIYRQPAAYSGRDYSFELLDTRIGRGYYRGGELIEEPMDFGSKNYISLAVLHDLIRRVMFPDAADAKERFNLSPGDYDFLYEYMSMPPRESKYPAYDDYGEYYDGYVKFFMFGDTKERIPDNIRIFNKVGLAYGFLIDNAYIIDTANNIEFLLSALIYVNEDGILNDNKYEYDEIGLPFLANLGRAIYDHELSRDRKFPPDLSRFKKK